MPGLEDQREHDAEGCQDRDQRGQDQDRHYKSLGHVSGPECLRDARQRPDKAGGRDQQDQNRFHGGQHAGQRPVFLGSHEGALRHARTKRHADLCQTATKIGEIGTHRRDILGLQLALRHGKIKPRGNATNVGHCQLSRGLVVHLCRRDQRRDAAFDIGRLKQQPQQHEQKRRNNREQEHGLAMIHRQRVQFPGIAARRGDGALPSNEKSHNTEDSKDQGQNSNAHGISIQQGSGGAGAPPDVRISSAGPSGCRRQQPPGSRPVPDQEPGHKRPAGHSGRPCHRTRRSRCIPAGRGSRRYAPS